MNERAKRKSKEKEQERVKQKKQSTKKSTKRTEVSINTNSGDEDNKVFYKDDVTMVTLHLKQGILVPGRVNMPSGTA